MSKKSLAVVLLLLALTLVVAACAPATQAPTQAPATMEPVEEPTEEPMQEEEPTAAPTIVEIAASDARFSTLVAAVQAAGLVDALSDPEAQLTVFAPTNEAFEAAFAALGITAEELLADTETLTSILLYHVVDGAVTSDVVVTLSEATTLQGSPVMISVQDGSVFVNESQVVQADVMASNGVIHVIDSVLLPPAEEAEQMPSIAEIAAGNEDFSTLVAALSAAGLVDTFAGEGAFTVFAPTNAAFEAAFAALGITPEQLLADTETLTSILTYHVVEGKLLAADVLSQNLLSTLNGAPALAYTGEDGAYIQNAKIVTTDIEASNGVIHVIDAVILPPAFETEATSNIVETAVANGSFTILAQALQTAGLVDVLAEKGPFTVFAPTDAAFEAALAELGITAEQLLADTETLTNILLYHVTVGALDSTAVLGSEALWMANGDPAAIDAEALTIAGAPINADLIDIEASNGIIHVINFVMLPPAE
jgi:transforming growth factor-beta-induced protein